MGVFDVDLRFQKQKKAHAPAYITSSDNFQKFGKGWPTENEKELNNIQSIVWFGDSKWWLM